MREERDSHQADEVLVGHAGARFPTPKQRKKLGAAEPPQQHSRHRYDAESNYVTAPDTSGVGRTGARFPSAKVVESLSEPPPPPPPPPSPSPMYVPTQPSRPRFAAPEPEPAAHESNSRTLVRPYVLTKGRTKSSRHLAIEALISAESDSPRWRSSEITGEFQSVRALCSYPRSVAEVAAILSVPLGVARVLLGDMADLGLVSIHDTVAASNGRPGIALIERVLHGLRRL
jgi:hypothetical protein